MVRLLLHAVVLIFVISFFIPPIDVLAQSLARYNTKSISFSKKDFVDTIRIAWEREQIYIPVQIEGRLFRFLLDTGAAQAVIYADTPVSGSKYVGKILSHDATGRMDTVQMVVLPPMTIGTVTFSGCQATIQQRPVQGRNFDGIIGFDLVNRGLYTKIDVRHQWLILTDRRHFFNGEQGIDIKYKLRYHVPYVDVSPFDSYSEPTLFDSGSRSLYAINRQSFETCAQKAGTLIDSQVEGRSVGRHAIGLSGTEPLSEVVFLNLSRLRMGDYTFSHLHTLTTMGDSHLGARVFDYGSMIFNPRKKRIRFQPYNQQIQASVDNEQLDIAFVSENGMPCVGLVWEQGEPYKQGFRQGDIILKIDDFIVKNFTHFVVWPFVVGREYRFTVKDLQGQSREIRWTRIKNRK